MPTGLRTPGARSSEFLVMLLNVAAQIILAAADVIGNGTATKLGVLGSVAYVVSRGLAKYEGRPVAPAPPTQPPAA